MRKRTFAAVLALVWAVGFAFLPGCAPARTPIPTTPAAVTPSPTTPPAATPSPTTPPPETPAATPGPRYGGTLIVGKEAEMVGLDPHMVTAFSSREIQELIYEGLVQADENMNIVGALAYSWEVQDNKTYTFHLRRNVYFHNGRPFVCEDAEYSYERIVEVKSPRAGRVADVEHMECIDDYTFVVTLKEPNAGFVGNLACGVGGPQPLIVPREVIEEYGDLSTVAVGTGPFVLSEYLPDEHTLLTKFEGYWNPELPYLDAIRFEIMPEESSRLAALRTGAIQLTELRGEENIALAKEIPGVTVLERPSMNFYALMFNTERDPFDDARVRGALSLAIDRQELIQLAVGGAAEALGVLPPVLADWALPAEEIPNWTLNLDQAKALLAEAGYADGLNAGTIACSEQYPLLCRTAEIYQQQWAQIGVTVDIRRVEWADYITTWRTSDFDMITELTAASCDPIGMSIDFHTEGGKNVSKNSDAELDRLLERAYTAPDFAARQQVCWEAQERIGELAPKVHLFAPLVHTAIADELHGFRQMPTEWRTYLPQSWLE